MKKIKKIMLTLLVMSFLANPMCLILRVHAANEEIAMSRISDTLQSVMQSSEEETIEVMIWLEDINTSQAVLSSTESILSAAKATLSPRALCENPETDAEIYSRYMDARKKAMTEAFELYTTSFAEDYLSFEEIVYSSRYAPIVIAKLSNERIIELASSSSVSKIGFYNYEFVSDEIEYEKEKTQYGSDIICDENGVNVINNDVLTGEYYYEMSTYCYDIEDVISYLGVDELRSYVNSTGNGINIGILEYQSMKVFDAFFDANNDKILYTEHYNTTYGEADTADPHATNVLEILYTILPQAHYYYARCDTSDSDFTLCSEVEWLIDCGVDVVTCSAALLWDSSATPAESYGTYGIVSQYIDYIVNEYNVIFVKSAGQAGPSVSMGGMAYNAIVVGNYDLSTGTVYEASDYYNAFVWANKPDICAPGALILNYGGKVCGNSFSTPIVAAVAALVVDYYDSMIFHGEVKSIICASTQLHRYESNSFIVNEELINFKKYGTGVLDASNVKQILLNNSSLYSNLGDGVVQRIHTIYLSQGLSNYIDIVLAFECNNGETSVYDIADLNITVYDANGHQVDFSMLNNGNVEVIRNLPATTSYYTVLIEQYYPAMYDGVSQITYYSLAWCYK